MNLKKLKDLIQKIDCIQMEIDLKHSEIQSLDRKRAKFQKELAVEIMKDVDKAQAVR